ncbi:Cellular adhesion and filamentous growth protein [Asimina triloba]
MPNLLRCQVHHPTLDLSLTLSLPLSQSLLMVRQEFEVVRRKKLSKEEVAQFRNAVIKDYYFQMYYDDLPIWRFIGKVDKEGKNDPSECKYYLYRHLQFDIQYNMDRVIEINVRTDPSALVGLTDDKEVEVEFMYTVK